MQTARRFALKKGIRTARTANQKENRAKVEHKCDMCFSFEICCTIKPQWCLHNHMHAPLTCEPLAILARCYISTWHPKHRWAVLQRHTHTNLSRDKKDERHHCIHGHWLPQWKSPFWWAKPCCLQARTSSWPYKKRQDKTTIALPFTDCKRQADRTLSRNACTHNSFVLLENHYTPVTHTHIYHHWKRHEFIWLTLSENTHRQIQWLYCIRWKPPGDMFRFDIWYLVGGDSLGKVAGCVWVNSFQYSQLVGDQLWR